MRQAEEAPRLIGDVLEIDEATVFADHVEQVAMGSPVAASVHLPGRALAGLGAFQPDEHRSAGRVACVADQPVAALAASGGKVMAADRFRLTAETLREV